MIRPIWMLLIGLLPACGGDLTAPAPTLEIRTVTSGQPTDPDGYTVRLDGGHATALRANDTVRLADLLPGRHQVELEGVAANCTLAGSNPRTVNVSGGDVTPVRFDVQCGAPSGALEIVVTTTGDQPDADGFIVSLDGSPGTPVGAGGGTLSIASVAAGEHEIRVGGLASNCIVVGGNLRRVTVAADPLHVDLEIRCNHPAGTISVTTTTAGPRPDPDGYDLTIGGVTQHITSAGALTLADLPVGTIEVRLEGLASNCGVDGANPRSVTVANGTVASVIFAVGCLPTGDGIVLFSSDRSGMSHLYRIREDGSDLRDLTPAFEADGGDWSPDRSRIVFARTSNHPPQLMTMDADGRHQMRLGPTGTRPKWSPDGRRIVFAAADGFITLINADGTGATRLVAGADPDWSPDGTRIAFDRVNRHRCVFDLICAYDILGVNADGTGEAVIAAGASASEWLKNPDWSPDGTEIAFYSACCFLGTGSSGVYTARSDGSGAHLLAQDLHVQGGPIWSPDGSLLLVTARRPDGSNDLMVFDATGGGAVALATAPGHDHPQAWR